MAVENSGDARLHLHTLFNVGAFVSLSDGQLLERFTTAGGERRELAFAALVERHGPIVLRVCRSVLRDEAAAEDAFQATFLALARKAGSLWTEGSLAPWLHQAAYRAAIHDRGATVRRRSHEHAAASLRRESVAPTDPTANEDLAKVIHEEVDRLPDRFRVTVVLCDLEGCTHEQAARHLGCSVGTVKSRLARGRKRLRGRLVRRGLAPALAAASAAGIARAAVPSGLAESAVAYAATARVAPTSVALITEGVLRSMLLRKVRFVTKVLVVVAAIAAGAVALAQSERGREKDRAGKPQDPGSASWTYHILAAREGESPRKVAVVELTGDTPIRIDAPGAIILIQPKHAGQPDRPATAAPHEGDVQVEALDKGKSAEQSRKIVLTNPKVMDVDIAQHYLCRINAHRHIEIRALESGFVSEIHVREGQSVKKGDRIIKIQSIVNNAKRDEAKAEADLAQVEFDNTKKLFDNKVVSATEVKLFEAKLAKAKARAKLMGAEPDFTQVVAPFDGIVGRLQEQQGSLVKEGDALTTLSDNSTMWVYFNVPEAQYLEYAANLKLGTPPQKIELKLANGKKFPQTGKIGAIGAQFNNENGNIPLRADFPNPSGLLRDGQAGTILIHRTVPDALVIPQRATYEVADRRYVYVVDKDNVAHRREIVIQSEADDLFVIKNGVSVGDKIVVDGVRQVHDGEKLNYEFRSPDEVMPVREN